MRVAENQRYRQVNEKVARAKDNNARSMDAASTLKSIRDIADDPVGMTRALRYRDQISSQDQHVKNIEMSKGYLETSEQAVASITDNLIRAKELAIGMANDTNNAQSRSAAAREVREIIDEIVMLANSNYNGRFVFGGYRNQNPPLTQDGDYVGDDGKIFVEVAPGKFSQINLTARDLFTPSLEEQQEGHVNMIHSLQRLYDALVGNEKFEVQKGLSELEFHLDKVTNYQASIGGMWNSINGTATRLAKETESAKARLSTIMDADAFAVMSDFKKTETILQSTLLSSNKVLQPSLLNFLQ
jgi:flagellar hook-associated protein 3 FlgL